VFKATTVVKNINNHDHTQLNIIME